MNYSNLSKIQDGKANTSVPKNIKDSKEKGKSPLDTVLDDAKKQDGNKSKINEIRNRIPDSLLLAIKSMSRKDRRSFLAKQAISDRRYILNNIQRVVDSKEKKDKPAKIKDDENSKPEKVPTSARIELVNLKNLVDNYTITKDSRIFNELKAFQTEELPEKVKEYVQALTSQKEVAPEDWQEVVKIYQDNNLRAPQDALNTKERVNDNSAIDKILESDYEDPITGEVVPLTEETNVLTAFIQAINEYVESGETAELDEVINMASEESDEESEDSNEEDEEKDKDKDKEINDSVKSIALHILGREKLTNAHYAALCDSINKIQPLPFTWEKGHKIEKVADSSKIIQAPLTYKEYSSLDKSHRNQRVLKVAKMIGDSQCLPAKSVTVDENYIVVLLENDEEQLWETQGGDITTILEELNLIEDSAARADFISDNFVSARDKAKASAKLNELDLLSSKFYKKYITDNHWCMESYPEELPQVELTALTLSENPNDVFISEEEGVLPYASTTIELGGEQFFIYVENRP